MTTTMKDEHDAIPIEQWMIGDQITELVAYTDGKGARWVKMTLASGRRVHIQQAGPWIIEE